MQFLSIYRYSSTVSSLNNITDEKLVILCHLLMARHVGAAPYRTPIQSLLRRLLSFVRSEAQLAAELASQQAATQRAIAVAESEQGILSRTVRVCDCFFKGEKEAAGCKNTKNAHTRGGEGGGWLQECKTHAHSSK